jgi:hypothetical protein
MTKEFYEKNYKDGELIYCMPVSKNLIAFVYKDMIEGKDLDETPIRAIYYVPNKLSLGNYGVSKWDYNIETLYISDNGTSWFVIDSSFQIDEIDNNTEWYRPKEQGKANLAKGITNIDGDVYAYGMVRSVFKYKGIKEWENITTETKHPNLYEDVNKSKEKFVGSWVGFSALDGFNANDIYAGGNRGDFWHYNGKKWRKIDLPTNFDISTITCGKDGLVYVGCRIGEVIIGRDNAWEVIGKAKEITHSCWFDGKAYLSSKDGRIYTYDAKKKDLVEAKFKTSYPEYMHHLIRGIASCEECLVAYTSVQAYAYDGEIWHEIIEVPSLSKHK